MKQLFVKYFILFIFLNNAYAFVFDDLQPISSFYGMCNSVLAQSKLVRCLGAWNKSEKEGGEYGKCFQHQNCTRAAAIDFRSDNPNKRTIHLITQNDEYVSIGFSDDIKMGNDMVISCLRDELRTEVSQNIGLKNFLTNTTSNITLESAMRGEDFTYCRISVEPWYDFINQYTQTPTEFHHILVVSGELKDNGDIGHHWGHAITNKPWKLVSSAERAHSLLSTLLVLAFTKLL